MWSKKNFVKKSEKSPNFYQFTKSQQELTRIRKNMASEAGTKKKKESICIIDFEIDETKACDQFCSEKLLLFIYDCQMETKILY